MCLVYREKERDRVYNLTRAKAPIKVVFVLPGRQWWLGLKGISRARQTVAAPDSFVAPAASGVLSRWHQTGHSAMVSAVFEATFQPVHNFPNLTERKKKQQETNGDLKFPSYKRFLLLFLLHPTFQCFDIEIGTKEALSGSWWHRGGVILLHFTIATAVAAAANDTSHSNCSSSSGSSHISNNVGIHHSFLIACVKSARERERDSIKAFTHNNNRKNRKSVGIDAIINTNDALSCCWWSSQCRCCRHIGRILLPVVGAIDTWR